MLRFHLGVLREAEEVWSYLFYTLKVLREHDMNMLITAGGSRVIPEGRKVNTDTQFSF